MFGGLNLNLRRVSVAGLSVALMLTAAGAAGAASLVFSAATATYEQGDFTAANSINGVTAGTDHGWAIARLAGDPATDTRSEPALFTLAAPRAAGSTDLTFTLTQAFGSQHELGYFSLGYATTAAPSLLSPETFFNVTAASAPSHAAFSITGGTLEVYGPTSTFDVYTITAHVNGGGLPITAIFLNAINAPAYNPLTGGPGRQPLNGNFVLTEFEVDAKPGVDALAPGGTGDPGGAGGGAGGAGGAGDPGGAGALGVPEPTTWAMLLTGFGGLGAMLRRARRRRAASA